jgi:NTE family protein
MSRGNVVYADRGGTEPARLADAMLWNHSLSAGTLRPRALIHMLLATSVVALLGLGGCATRPINPPITHVDPGVGYRFQSRLQHFKDKEDIVVLAFSGGGTRAAAFSYGVLEALRRIEVIGPKGDRQRIIDSVNVIAGVSGGSFTALAYGLYGDQLFAEYEQRFLKRNVEGELLGRAFSPRYWPSLASANWGRSELASELYDEILFNGATYADLERGKGPMVVATATDLSSGARFFYTQAMFDIMCSDLGSVRLSRAAASSSGVPVVLSPVTLNNYGGTCGYREPPLLRLITDPAHPARPEARALQELKELRSYEDGKERPYIHLVDGSVSDNLGVRGIIDIMDELEALHMLGFSTRFDSIKRLVVFVVNSHSARSNDWDKSESPPGTLEVMLKATGVPIDHYSYEAVEVLRDTAARWKMLRRIRDSGAIADKNNPAMAEVIRVPDIEVYVVDVSFAGVKDKAEREYLNNLPTSFALPPEAVDRLRAAAGSVMLDSPDFRQYLKDMGERIVAPH